MLFDCTKELPISTPLPIPCMTNMNGYITANTITTGINMINIRIEIDRPFTKRFAVIFT
jgi:hypothetical protein